MTAYTAPTVTLKPVAEKWVPGSQFFENTRYANTERQRRRPEAIVTLNLRTGELTAHSYLDAFDREMVRRSESHWRGAGWYGPSADMWMRGYYWGRTPTSLAWAADYGPWTKTADGVNATLAAVLPLAQQLVDALDPVPGTDGDYDWTLRAAALERLLDFAFSSYEDADRIAELVQGLDEDRKARPSSGVITFAELIQADPDLVDPKWATMTDEQLDEVAGLWTGDGDHGGKWISDTGVTGQRLCAHFNWGCRRDGVNPEGDYHPHMTFSVLHARTDLRRWRDEALQRATGLPTVYATERFPDGYAGDDLTASCTDDAIDWIAAVIDATAAHTDKVALVGTRDMLLRQRAEMRARVRKETETVGQQAEKARERYLALCATRDGLTMQVIGFGEEPEHNPDGTRNFAAIGRLASISRVAAGTKFKVEDPETQPATA